MIRAAVVAALLIGAHVQAQAPIMSLLDIECEEGHVSALILQINPIDRPKIVQINITKTACGTPT